MIEKMINVAVRNLKSYVAGAVKEEVADKHGLDPEKVIKLASNENPYRPSPKAIETIKSHASQVSLYPEDYPRELIKSISDYIGLPEEFIIPGGNGADEVLDLVIKATISPGDEVIIHPPTFSYYKLLISLYGGRIVRAPLAQDYSFSTDDIMKKIGDKTKLIIICSPNNPTGSTISEQDLRRILDSGKLVLLDEAYVEFMDKSLTRLVSEFENLIVLRTFSKAFGLAGLRVGYGVAQKKLAVELMKIKPPHNVNLLAQKAAVAALSDLDYMKKTVDKIRGQREEVYQELSKLSNIKVYPSEANFLLLTVREGGIDDMIRRLEKKGIILRGCKSFGLEKSIRVTIGTHEENQVFLREFKEALR